MTDSSPGEEMGSLPGSKTHDPFDVVENKGGYSPGTFMTTRGPDSEEPISVSVKMNRKVYAFAMAHIVNNDEFPEFKSVHDLFNDALWHRLMWFLKEHDVQLTQRDRDWMQTAAIDGRLAQERSRQRDMDDFFSRTLQALRDAVASEIPANIDAVIAEARQIASTIPSAYVEPLFVAIDQAQEARDRIAKAHLDQLFQSQYDIGAFRPDVYSPFGVADTLDYDPADHLDTDVDQLDVSVHDL